MCLPTCTQTNVHILKRNTKYKQHIGRNSMKLDEKLWDRLIPLQRPFHLEFEIIPSISHFDLILTTWRNTWQRVMHKFPIDLIHSIIYFFAKAPTTWKFYVYVFTDKPSYSWGDEDICLKQKTSVASWKEPQRRSQSLRTMTTVNLNKAWTT